jgi:hypothetical protein
LTILVDTQLAIWRNELMNNAHEQTALTDDERRITIRTALDCAQDEIGLDKTIKACVDWPRFVGEPAKAREAFAIALVWGTVDPNRL